MLKKGRTGALNGAMSSEYLERQIDDTNERVKELTDAVHKMERKLSKNE